MLVYFSVVSRGTTVNALDKLVRTARGFWFLDQLRVSSSPSLLIYCFAMRKSI